jgi:methionyl-tRNA synthetase
MKYDFREIESKWQKRWEDEKVFEAVDFSEKPKFFSMVEFPYPSGAGMHVGHIKAYSGLEVVSRKRRMQGYNVLYPMGWDAFGAPAEQYAIKNHIHPKAAVKENIATFKKQMQTLGFSFDWTREFSTTDPEYYKWTQWQFLQFYKHGMAYKDTIPVNWCPTCKSVLSNEDAAGGVCERCGDTVVQKEKSQWMLRMGDYAEDLLKGLDYSQLNDSFVIFVCQFDPFNADLPCYTFKNLCLENKNIELSDGTTKVIFNSSAYEKENNLEISAFLKYIKTKVPTSNFTDRLHRLVEEHKLNNKFKNEYLAMNLHDRDITRKAFAEGEALGIEKGISQGAEQKTIETAKNMILQSVGTLEQISLVTGLSVEEINKLKEE